MAKTECAATDRHAFQQIIIWITYSNTSVSLCVILLLHMDPSIVFDWQYSEKLDHILVYTQKVQAEVVHSLKYFKVLKCLYTVKRKSLQMLT